MTVAERLTLLMRYKRASIYKLAAAARVDKSVISYIRRGRTLDPRKATLTKLAAGLGMTYEEFMKADIRECDCCEGSGARLWEWRD